MTAGRLLGAARWAPVAAALVYLYVLMRRLPDIAGQLTWNADYVSQMAIAEWVGAHGLPHRAVVIQLGYFWFDLATRPLPFHIQVWEYAPSAMAALTVAAIGWNAWRLAGPFAAALAGALSLGASPLVLSTEVAQAYHGSTWLGTALLAAYASWLLTSKASRPVVIAASIATGAAIGFATASDPLLGPAGDAPLAAALVLAWRARPDQVGRPHLAAGAVLALTALLTAGVTVLAGRVAGFTSSFPRGLTHFVTPQHFAGNVRQLAGGLFEVAGRENGSAVGMLLGVLLIAGVLVPFVYLARGVRGTAPAPMLAATAFWSASALFVAGAFLFSDIPADFVETSSRYLVPMFFVAAASVPLWAGDRTWRGLVVAAPAVLLILANAGSVEHDASSGAFKPNFSTGLDAPIAFLESHGLQHGYAAYDEASPISLQSGFALHVYPVTEFFVTPGDTCGPPPRGAICPYAYNSASDWYAGEPGPSFVIVDPEMVRLSHPPLTSLDDVIATYTVGRFTILVYGDDVAAHMGTPVRFTRPLL